VLRAARKSSTSKRKSYANVALCISINVNGRLAAAREDGPRGTLECPHRTQLKRRRRWHGGIDVRSKDNGVTPKHASGHVSEDVNVVHEHDGRQASVNGGTHMMGNDGVSIANRCLPHYDANFRCAQPTKRCVRRASAMHVGVTRPVIRVVRRAARTHKGFRHAGCKGHARNVHGREYRMKRGLLETTQVASARTTHKREATIRATLLALARARACRSRLLVEAHDARELRRTVSDASATRE